MLPYYQNPSPMNQFFGAINLNLEDWPNRSGQIVGIRSSLHRNLMASRPHESVPIQAAELLPFNSTGLSNIDNGAGPIINPPPNSTNSTPYFTPMVNTGSQGNTGGPVAAPQSTTAPVCTLEAPCGVCHTCLYYNISGVHAGATFTHTSPTPGSTSNTTSNPLLGTEQYQVPNRSLNTGAIAKPPPFL